MSRLFIFIFLIISINFSYGAMMSEFEIFGTVIDFDHRVVKIKYGDKVYPVPRHAVNGGKEPKIGKKFLAKYTLNELVSALSQPKKEIKLR